MAANVDRRESKGRFNWMRSSKEPKPVGGKLAKSNSRRASHAPAVSGPRKMGAPAASASVDSLVKERIELKDPGVSGASVKPNAPDAGDWNSPKPTDMDIAFERPPAWAVKSGEWTAPELPPQPRYDVHEPNGPAWYINHHLRPPQSAMPPSSTYPHSVFSPRSNNASSSQLNSQQSSSSLARPSRSRQGRYHDDVDSLDVSDPHGTQWHHTSPYDLGRPTPSRPRSAVGPGVGTYNGPIEGSELLEQVRVHHVKSNAPNLTDYFIMADDE